MQKIARNKARMYVRKVTRNQEKVCQRIDEDLGKRVYIEGTMREKTRKR